MATHIQPSSTFAESVIHVEGQMQSDEEQHAELFGELVGRLVKCLEAHGPR